MPLKPTIYILLFVLSATFLASCSNTKFLSGDQLLYTGRNKLTVIGPEKYKNRNDAKQVIESVTSFKPNNSVAGKRMLPPGGLWIYNYMKPKEMEKKSISRWFYRTFSKEPILVSQVNPEMRSKKLESELFNSGFFHSSVSSKIDTSARNPRKAKITYTIKLDHPFIYNSVFFAPAETALDSLISSYPIGNKIKPGDVFNLGNVKAETKKIISLVNENGYYFFNSDNILWTADTMR
jgi:hypothetical protein